MSHQPPKESKKKPLLSPKEKKLARQQRKLAGSTPLPVVKR
jgi:hypothetical protein